MNLPSFLWLWKIAAWSMGFSLLAYFLLAISGGWMLYSRQENKPRPKWLRPFHYFVGGTMVFLVLLLLAIGLIGTLGHYGSLGHSVHLIDGLTVVTLVIISAVSATQISARKPWARSLHLTTNIILFFAFAAVSVS
ncbi:MAG: DUF4079 domain-containing protein, partial [Okeania sp. SIO2H7]|nr:DUF4079 domain-containing protein [Okeania sp. SIO2H7]